MTKKNETPADEVAENRASVDREGDAPVYREPKVGDNPKVMRHQVDPLRNVVEEDQDERGPIPRRADPHAFQRDEKAAKAEHKKEAAKEDDKDDGKK